jgi:predicted nuclease of predicted toxin-antitoxin system
MPFLVDAQLPPALARWFQEQGYKSSAVANVGLRDAVDTEIWDFALNGDWVIVTKDQDFAARVVQEEVSPQVVWLRIGNSSNEILIA